ncbi:glutamate-rich protein 3 [Gavia stellata]|uniref:glutamate-rich protein 3 n=1 Tax=Gavia stellata TaxID=37040 RepID=UPI0028A1309C|nr:glutamate-rich protein 3 [Gavia stellata]
MARSQLNVPKTYWGRANRSAEISVKTGRSSRLLATYNSLTDKHLAGYFSNIRMRRHLRRSGLISRSGRIISQKEYQLNAMRRDHQRHIQECLARLIFRKIHDMERHHQLEMKRKLENSLRKDRVQKIKVEQFRRSVEGASPVRSPHPPLGPRNHYRPRPPVAGEPAGHSQLRAPGPVVDCNGGYPSHQPQSKEPAISKMAPLRPNTVPGNTQRSVRLRRLRSCAAAGSLPKTSSSEEKCHAPENDQQFASGGERSGLRPKNSVEHVTGISPYQVSVVNNYVIPVPHPPLQKGNKSENAVRNGMPRGRRFRPATAPNDLEQLLTKNSGGFPKPPLHSNALVTMVFLGKSVHLAHADADYRDEIKVYQQHCGGENLCVYKGNLLEGESFQFVSKRHHGFPFSLTFFLNGMQVDRLSCCCEYKHQKHSRLGGRSGYFGFLNVEGASPCYRCIIAMHPDKKPSPPKRNMEDHEEKHVGSWRDEACSEPSKSSVEQKSSKDSVPVISPGHEAIVETIEDKMETGEEYGKEERKKLSDRESEASQEETDKNEYDEDFEADEEFNEEEQTGDQMNGMSKSSSDDKTHNLDYEKESQNSSQEALQDSDSEKDESDGYSDSDSEDDQEDRRPAHSCSSISNLYSSEDDSYAETMKDNVKGEEEYNVKRASDNAAHAQYGNEENKLLRMEENQKTFALEKEGLDEAEKANPEDLTARKKTGIFRENIMAIQHQSPEVNGELKQAVSVESNIVRLVIADYWMTSTPLLLFNGFSFLFLFLNFVIVFEDWQPVQKEIAKAIGNLHPVNSEPEPSDSCEDEEEENITSTKHDANEAPDGAFLAKGTRTLDVEKAAGQVVREGQMVGERQALEEEDFVAEGGDARTEEAGEGMARVGDLLPKEDTGAVLQAEESAPEESAMAEEDPKGKGTGKGVESGAEVAPGQQEVLMEGTESEAAWGEQAPGAEEPARAGALLGREADGAVSEGEEVAGEVSDGEEATGSPVKEVVGETVSEAEEAVEEGGFAGKGLESGAVSEAEETVDDASLAEEGIAGVDGPGGEESAEEAVAEGEEAVDDDASLAGEGIAGVDGPGGEESAEEAVAEGEEAVDDDASLAGEGFALVDGPGGEESAEEAVAEGEEAVDDTSLAGEGFALVDGPGGEESAEEAVAEGEETLDDDASLAGECFDGVDGPGGEESAEEAVAEGEEAVDDTSLAGEGFALVDGPGGEESAEESVAEGEETVDDDASLAGEVFALVDGPGGEESAEEAVAEGEETVDDVSLAGEGFALVDGPGGEESAEEAVAEGEETVDDDVSLAGERFALVDGPGGEESAEEAVAEGEEAVDDTSLAGEGFALVDGPGGEASAEEAVAEGEETVHDDASLAGEGFALVDGPGGEESAEEAVAEGEEAVDDDASLAGERFDGVDGPGGEESAEEDLAEGEEAVDDTSLAGEGFALVDGPGGEESAEEAVAEGEETVDDDVSLAGECFALVDSPGEESAEEAVSDGKETVGDVSLAGEGFALIDIPGEASAEEAVSEGDETVDDVSLAGEGFDGVDGPGEESAEEALSEGEEAVDDTSLAGEGFALVDGPGGEESAEEAISEGEEAVDDASLAGEGFAGVDGPGGEESAEEAISEGEEAVEKPGALLETLGDTNVCSGEARPRGEGSVKPNEFSQLKASGAEWMEMGKAAMGAATSETGKASEVEGSSLLRAEDTVEESVEPGKGPMLQTAPGLEALVDAGGDDISEGSSQLEEITTVEEEEGSAEALLGGNPSLGSNAKTECAMEEKPNGGVMGVPAEITGAESGGREEVTGGTACPRDLAAGMEGPLECAEERGKKRPLGEGGVEGPGPPALWLCVSRAREAVVVVAGAVVGGQAGWGALPEGAVGEPMLAAEVAGQEGLVAGDSGAGDGAVAQEGVTGAVWGGQGGTGAATAERVSAEGKEAAGESGRVREAVGGGAVACGQGVNREAVLGCEGRGPAAAGTEGQAEAEREWDTARLMTLWHGELCGAMAFGEQPIAETSPSTPAHGDGGAEPRGRGSVGGEGLCPGTQPQLAALGTGAVGGEDGPQEGTEQAGAKAEGEQAGLRESTREGEVVGVVESARSASGVREQSEDSPAGGSPDAQGDADTGERSCSPHEVSPAWVGCCPPRPFGSPDWSLSEADDA